MKSQKRWSIIAPILIVIVIGLIGVLLKHQSIESYPSLWNSVDPQFQRAVDRALNEVFQEKTASLVDSKKLGLVVVDITELHRPRVAAYNPDEMMYAASLPKIAILLGALVQVDRGEMKLTEELRVSLTRMIRHSSNPDATAVLEQVGYQALADILQSEPFRLYDPARNGGLWVGRPYSQGDTWKRDPLHGISHGATAMQVARFYYLGVTGRLVSEPLLTEAREILSAPAIHHKFVKGLDRENPDAEIYRKSGTWKQFHSDSGVIVDEEAGYRYIIVALTEHPKGSESLARLAAAVDRTIRKIHNETS